MSPRYYYAAYVDGSCVQHGTSHATAAAAASLIAFHAIGRTVAKQKDFVWAVEGPQNSHRAELAAVVYTLERLTFACAINVHTDSETVIKGASKAARSHMKSTRAENADLWERLDVQMARHTVRLIWCKGHDRAKAHNRVDKLARKEARRLYSESLRGNND